MHIKLFTQLGKGDVRIAGGKGASLGEMTQAGIPVPPGFVVLSDAFEAFLKETDINVEIDSILHEVDPDKMHTVEDASAQIQALIRNAEMPEELKKEIRDAFGTFDAEFVAVRSSATAEDGAADAWAGQLDSFLNTTEDALLENVKNCWASLFTPRAIFYRFEKNLHATDISVAVVVQKMVDSVSAGVAFSVHPVTEDRNQLIIEAAFGLGEAVVSGQVTPDSYVVEKEPRRIIDQNVNTQKQAIYRDGEGGGNALRELPEAEGSMQVLPEAKILELSELITRIEAHYGFPVDIEWAYEGGIFFIVQSRPITTLKKNDEKGQINKEHEGMVLVGKYPPVISVLEATTYIKNAGHIFYSDDRFSFTHEGGINFFDGNSLYLLRDVNHIEHTIEVIKNDLKDFSKKVENMLNEARTLDVDKNVPLSPKSLDKFGKALVLQSVPYAFEQMYNLSKTDSTEINALLEHFALIRRKVDSVQKSNEEWLRKNLISLSKKYKVNLNNATYDEFFQIILSSEKVKDDIAKKIKAREKGYILDYQITSESAPYSVHSSLSNIYKKLKALIDSFESDSKDEKEKKQGNYFEGVSLSKGAVEGESFLFEKSKATEIPEQKIIIARYLDLHDIEKVMQSSPLAVVVEQASVTSHVAIHAREMSLPVVVAPKIVGSLDENTKVRVDANTGIVWVIDAVTEERGVPETAKSEKCVPQSHFKKAFVRDITYIMAQAGFYGFDELGERAKNPYGEPIAFCLDDGVLEVWVNERSLNWFNEQIIERLQNDPALLQAIKNNHERKLHRIEAVLDKDEKNIDTIKELIDAVIDIRAENHIMFTAATESNWPEDVQAWALEERNTDEMWDNCDKVIREILVQAHPQIEGYENALLPSEIEAPPELDVLKKRSHSMVCTYAISCQTLSRDAFQEAHPQFVFEEVFSEGEAEEVKGQPAFAGNAKGVVRVVRKKSEIANVNEGDILVSPMTTPDYVSAIKRAAAIVTDEGGITCHAAIISRELKKPCVIGTQSATQVLKDGDEVEVDADNGVVRIIS